MHPYEVAQTLRSRAKHESIRLNYGSLYGVVELLEKRGFVSAARPSAREDGPNARSTRSPPPGLGSSTTGCPISSRRPSRSTCSSRPPCRCFRCSRPTSRSTSSRSDSPRVEVRIAQAQGTRAATEAAGLPRLFEIEGAYVEALDRAELEFVGELVHDIESGQLDGLDMWRSWFEGTGDMTWHPPDPPST